MSDENTLIIGEDRNNGEDHSYNAGSSRNYSPPEGRYRPDGGSGSREYSPPEGRYRPGGGSGSREYSPPEGRYRPGGGSGYPKIYINKYEYTVPTYGVVDSMVNLNLYLSQPYVYLPRYGLLPLENNKEFQCVFYQKTSKGRLKKIYLSSHHSVSDTVPVDQELLLGWRFIKTKALKEKITDEDKFHRPDIPMDILLVVNQVHRRIAMIVSDNPSHSTPWVFFVQKSTLLSNIGQTDSVYDPKMRDYLRGKPDKCMCALVSIRSNFLKKRYYSFQLTNTLYHKISVLHLVSPDIFYIQIYVVSLFQTSGSEFKKAIEERVMDRYPYTNHHRSRISKIAFSFPDTDYSDSNLWDSMYTSESILTADKPVDGKNFRHFYSIMQGKMPRGAIVKKLGTPDKVVGVEDIFYSYDEAAYGNYNLATYDTGYLLQKGAFVLCLWDSNPFVY